jgi:hypothetical protein
MEFPEYLHLGKTQITIPRRHFSCTGGIMGIGTRDAEGEI